LKEKSKRAVRVSGYSVTLQAKALKNPRLQRRSLGDLLKGGRFSPDLHLARISAACGQCLEQGGKTLHLKSHSIAKTPSARNPLIIQVVPSTLQLMIETLRWLAIFIIAAHRERRDLALENLALRQQLGVLKRRKGVPRLKRKDRLFWVVLSRIWAPWRQALHRVNGDTVVGGQRKGFRVYGARISKRKSGGGPQASSEVRALIQGMATANPYWGAPRIHGELLKLGMEISERTVSRLMPKSREPPSQTWKAFLNNHIQDLVAIDFFTVPTATFRVLFVLVMLAHHRRRIVHFNVTEHPTAWWTGRQMVEAFPEDTARRYLLRDRDKIYGDDFRSRVKGMGIQEVTIAPCSPWQNPFAERLVGSI